MRISVDGFDRELQGTPMEILVEMRRLAFARAQDTIGDYVRWMAERTGLELVPPKDEQDHDAAALTLAALDRGRLVRILDDSGDGR